MLSNLFCFRHFSHFDVYSMTWQTFNKDRLNVSRFWGLGSHINVTIWLSLHFLCLVICYLCEIDFLCHGWLACVTRVRYDSSSAAYNLLILIIVSQVWSQINILVSECDNRDIILCPVYTAPYVRLSRALIGQSSQILASDWSISPI